jgi:protein disulfide-isomerase A6
MRAAAAVLVASLLIVAASAAFYGKNSAVVNLTPENFDQEVIASEDVWLVEFYAPWCGHCKHLTPEWEAAAKTLKGSVKLGAVDADAFRELGGRYSVQGFPTIKVFGFDKKSPKDYEGGRTSTAIVDAAKRALKNLQNAKEGKPEEPEEKPKRDAPPAGFYVGTDVVELTDATFESDVINGKEPWLIEFYAPWCGHCKNLAPAWKAAATELAGAGFKIGAVDATVHEKFSKQYGVQGFPTIKFFAPGKADAPEDYQGGRSKEEIVAYCSRKAEAYPSTPPNVGQFADQADLVARCTGKTLCVVFIVPHVMDTGAAGREELVARFSAIAGQVRARSVAVGWIAGGDHVGFEEAVGIRATYPTFAALNVKTLRGVTHKGGFSAEALLASIRKILDGKTAIVQLKALPQLSQGVALWDGKDYVPPADDE